MAKQLGLTGGEAYACVAEELDVEPAQRREALASLEPAVVEMAKAYAKRAHKAWPPKPTRSGWSVRIWSL